MTIVKRKEEDPEETGISRNVNPVEAILERLKEIQLTEDQGKILHRLLGGLAEEETLPAESEIDEQDEELQVLIFELGNEFYGLDIREIYEIIDYSEPAEVPHTVDFLDGVISLRGRMIPVINARKRLGHPPKDPDLRSRVIVIHQEADFHGILVDSATEVARIKRTEIEPTPPVVVGIAAEFIDGVSQWNGHFIIFLNLKRFLEFP